MALGEIIGTRVTPGTMKIGKIINIWEVSPHQGLSEARRGKGVFFAF